MFAIIREGWHHGAVKCVVDLIRNCNTTRLSYAFKPGCDIDSVAVDVALIIVNDVAQMHTNAKLDGRVI